MLSFVSMTFFSNVGSSAFFTLPVRMPLAASAFNFCSTSAILPVVTSPLRTVSTFSRVAASPFHSMSCSAVTLKVMGAAAR